MAFINCRESLCSVAFNDDLLLSLDNTEDAPQHSTAEHPAVEAGHVFTQAATKQRKTPFGYNDLRHVRAPCIWGIRSRCLRNDANSSSFENRLITGPSVWRSAGLFRPPGEPGRNRRGCTEN